MKSRKRVCQPTYPKFSMETQGVGTTVSVNVSFWGKPWPQCQPINGKALEVEEKEPCLNMPPCPEEEEYDQPLLSSARLDSSDLQPTAEYPDEV
ncbi:properdin-like [Terrapene carolina triunguis]|uniref:properdin-like n=1 Tax=Terrapene triunguis TaxID=2587831 RepID=UPI000E77814B|nr:properdin-like [Terrapene carolina triunguis]